MRSAAFDRIMTELTVHPKERVGIDPADVESLFGREKTIVLEELLARAEEGFGAIEPLELLLGTDFTRMLKKRLLLLPEKAHGQVILRYILYLKEGR